MTSQLTFYIPIRTVSEANKTGEHWSLKSKRHKAQRLAICAYLKPTLLNSPVELPCSVILTRIAPRYLDTDNLQSSFKSVRDQIGELLTGETTKGRGDGDDRIEWHYYQEKGKPKIYGIKIEIPSRLKFNNKY